MILIRYSKLNGGEFIPHLDTLRHLTKILRRANISVNYSKGFNPHTLIYMSSPIALGLKSSSEYCFIDTLEDSENFKEKFNLNAPKGIRCEEVWKTDKKVKIASDITKATYEITGINKFNVDDILNLNTFTILDKKGVEKEVREKIVSLNFEGDKLVACLKFGNDTLRPDYLASKLISIYGGEHVDIIKTSVTFLENKDTNNYLESL